MREALAAGEFEELDGGRFRAAGHELGPDEVLVERGGREGFAVASAGVLDFGGVLPFCIKGLIVKAMNCCSFRILRATGDAADSD